MNSRKMISLRLGLALLMGGTTLGAGAHAQNVVPSPYGETAGDALNRNLRLIADQPRNVSALLGAGRAALELGDPQAALTFFARAEEVAPRDGRVKAGMGAAFVQMEQAPEAFKFFRDAASLGVPEAEFAGDRGLAYDLSGDPRRAQADYMLALRRQEDPEIRRRLALSLGISGERDKALATIDSQLRAQDRAAWRVRSFILALTGDAAEATRSAEAAMPTQAAQLRPFFAALPRLKPADRALAVHFGHFPDNPGAVQVASAQTQYASAAPAPAAATPEPANLSRRPRAAEPLSAAPRERTRAENAASAERRPTASSAIAERYGWTGRGPAERSKPVETKPTALADGSAPARTVAAPARAQQPALAAQQAPAASPPQQQASVAPQPQPIATAQAQVRAPLQTVPGASFATGQTASAGPSFRLAAPPPASPQTQIQATPGIQTTDVAPSQVQTQIASAAVNPSPASPPPAGASSAPHAPGLTGLAETLQSLSSETAATPAKAEPKPAAPAQLALGTAAKPAYSPKFETARPAAPEKKKEEPAKEVAARDAAPPKRDEARTAAAKKDADLKTASAKKEADTKAASAKKDTDTKSAAARKDADTKTAARKDTAKTAEAKKDEPKGKEPSRHWVQIAGGADDAAMTREFLRLRAKAPKLLAARAAWTTPLRATNRLLVGPFKSDEDAQDFVNELSKSGVSAFSWTSPAGQEIVKLASK